MKNSLLVVYSTNILVRLLTGNMKNCLTPKNPKMCDPILVTLSKMRPHHRQSIRENATPSSGSSPLASYREVPPPPGQLSENPNLTGNTVIIMNDWEVELRATLTLDLLRVDLTSLNRTKDFFENRLLTLGDWVGMAGRTTAKVLRWNLSYLYSKKKKTTTTTKRTNWKLWPDRRLNGTQPEPSRPRHSFYLP